MIFTFEAQAFTILFAVLAIFKVKPYLFLLSTILNLLTVFCMWFVSYALSYWYAKTFQVGFWFTFCSATVFLWLSFNLGDSIEDKFHVKVAKTKEKIKGLLEIGYEFMLQKDV